MNNRLPGRILTGLIGVLACMIAFGPVLSHASSWDPETVLTDFMKHNYPWENVSVTGIKVYNALPSEAPENIIVEKGPLGKAVFSLMFSNGSRHVVKAHVTAMAPVVRSKRAHRKGHVISAEDIYIASMDIRKLPKSSIKRPEDVIGKSLKRSISVNVPIVENMVESAGMVKKGKRVLLVVNQMGLNIKAPGVIKEKGYVGSMVRAMNMTSRKEVVGVLIDANTVRVEL